MFEIRNATCKDQLSPAVVGGDKTALAENYDAMEQWMKRVREAFAEEMFTPEGLLKQELQGNYILALRYNMAPEENRPKLLARLKELIIGNDCKLDTGFMSVAHLLDTLYDCGEKELAWKMLMQNQCPGWMFEVEHGATTMWESWDAVHDDGAVSDQSFNHYAFGCVGDFLYRRVLGIQNAGLGYDRVRLAPDYACGLRYASGSHEGVNGTISLRWEKELDGWHISGQFPPNTIGTLVLPSGREKELESGSFDFYVSAH